MATKTHENLIYDVGMHRGEDTAFYLAKGFQVVAFEADPELAANGRERFHQQIASGALQIVEGAIISPKAAEQGTTSVRFYRNEKTSVWGTIDSSRAEHNARIGSESNVTEVRAIDFAAVLRERGIPHYLKIDIEGADMFCLEALLKVEGRPNYVSIESDKCSFRAVKEEFATLSKLGYSSYMAVEQSSIFREQHPPNPSREGRFVAHEFERGCSGLFGAELPGKWHTAPELLRRYWRIRFGYMLLGDNGIMHPWKFRGSWRLRELVKRWIGLPKEAEFVWWFDTHARLTHS